MIFYSRFYFAFLWENTVNSRFWMLLMENLLEIYAGVWYNIFVIFSEVSL